MVRGSWRSWRRTRRAVARVRRASWRVLSVARCACGHRAALWCASSVSAGRRASSTRRRKASSTVRVRCGRGGRRGCRRRGSRPSRMRSRRWQRSASSMTWEEIRRVAPRSAAMGWKRVQSSRRRTGSRPTVGSSRTRSSGVPRRATARETRLSWPPERLPARASACVMRSTSAMARVTSRGGGRRRRGRGRGRGEVVEVLAGGQVVVDGGGLGDVADAGAQGGGRRRAGRGRPGCR